MSGNYLNVSENAPLTKRELFRYFDQFKIELLKEVRLVAKSSREPFDKKWMKSSEVRAMLGLSHGKLQTMRNTGIIKFTKIGGAIYYDKEDIISMFENNRVKR